LLKLQETRIAQNIVFFGKIWYTSLMNKIMLGFIMLSLIVVNGCAFSKLAGGAIGVIETAINTTGKIAEGTGKIICTGGNAVGKIVEAVGKSADTGGKAIELVAATPGAKEAVVSYLIP